MEAMPVRAEDFTPVLIYNSWLQTDAIETDVVTRLRPVRSWVSGKGKTNFDAQEITHIIKSLPMFYNCDSTQKWTKVDEKPQLLKEATTDYTWQFAISRFYREPKTDSKDRDSSSTWSNTLAMKVYANSVFSQFHIIFHKIFPSEWSLVSDPHAKSKAKKYEMHIESGKYVNQKLFNDFTCHIKKLRDRYKGDNLEVPIGVQYLTNEYKPTTTVRAKGLDKVMAMLPGIHYLKLGEELKSDDWNGLIYPKREMLEGTSTIKYYKVVMICWIPPTIASIIDAVNFYEMDGTFKSVSPYTSYCIQGVANNTGIPMAVGASPTETASSFAFIRYCTVNSMQRLMKQAATYQNVPEEKRNAYCKWLYFLITKYEQMAMLSDRGTGLECFAKNASHTNSNAKGIPHYWCYRHLIEWWGTRSIHYKSFQRILYSRSREDAEKEAKKLRNLVTTVLAEAEKNKGRGTKSEAYKREVDDLRSTLKKLTCLMENYNKWGVTYKRESRHLFVAETTNHTEGSHARLNDHIRSARTATGRYYKTIEYELKKLDKVSVSMQRNAENAFKDMQKKYGKSKKDLNTCICGQSELFNTMFLTKDGLFPCPCSAHKFQTCPKVQNPWHPEHHLSLLSEVIIVGDDELSKAGITLDNPWDFQTSRRKQKTPVPSNFLPHLSEYHADESARSFFFGVRDRIVTDFALSEDNATWEVFRYVSKLNCHLGYMTEHKKREHEIRMRIMVSGKVNPRPAQDTPFNYLTYTLAIKAPAS